MIKYGVDESQVKEGSMRDEEREQHPERLRPSELKKRDPKSKSSAADRLKRRPLFVIDP